MAPPHPPQRGGGPAGTWALQGRVLPGHGVTWDGVETSMNWLARAQAPLAGWRDLFVACRRGGWRPPARGGPDPPGPSSPGTSSIGQDGRAGGWRTSAPLAAPWGESLQRTKPGGSHRSASPLAGHARFHPRRAPSWHAPAATWRPDHIAPSWPTSGTGPVLPSAVDALSDALLAVPAPEEVKGGLSSPSALASAFTAPRDRAHPRAPGGGARRFPGGGPWAAVRRRSSSARRQLLPPPWTRLSWTRRPSSKTPAGEAHPACGGGSLAVGGGGGGPCA